MWHHPLGPEEARRTYERGNAVIEQPSPPRSSIADRRAFSGSHYQVHAAASKKEARRRKAVSEIAFYNEWQAALGTD